MQKKALLSVICILFSFAGCSYFSEQTHSSPQQGGGFSSQKFPEDPVKTEYPKVPIQAFQVPEGEKPSNVEIMWQVPDENVEGFVIKLGYSPEKLESEIRLRTSEVEKYNDPSFGTVYRHVVHDIPSGQPLYVAVASLIGGAPSTLSEVFEVKAVK